MGRLSPAGLSMSGKRSSLRGLIALSMMAVGITAPPAFAVCSTTSQYPSHMVRMNSAIPGIKECALQMCNLESECLSARPRCLNGACMAPAGTGGATGRIPLIVGAAEVEKFAASAPEMTVGRRAFNSAYLARPGEPLDQPYRKRVLVPFAEYLPHPDFIPWPEWLAPRVSEMTPGQSTQLFNVSRDLSIGALICWEKLFAPLARKSAQSGAQILMQLNNDV